MRYVCKIQADALKVEICVHYTSPFDYFSCIISQDAPKVKGATRVRLLLEENYSVLSNSFLQNDCVNSSFFEKSIAAE